MWYDTQSAVEIMEQEGRTQRSLIEKLKDPGNLNEGDLFAAYFLAAGSLRSRDFDLSKILMNGFYAVLEELVKTRTVNAFSFAPFLPLVVMDLTAFIGITDSPGNPLSLSPVERELMTYGSVSAWKRCYDFLNMQFEEKDQKRCSWRVSSQWLLTLKEEYGRRRDLNGSGDIRMDVRSILDTPTLPTAPRNLDKEYIYGYFKDNVFQILEQWERPSMEAASRYHWCYRRSFEDILSYHIGLLVLEVLDAPSSGPQLDPIPRITAANGLFACFHRIEDILWQLGKWINLEGEGFGIGEDQLDVEAAINAMSFTSNQVLSSMLITPFIGVKCRWRYIVRAKADVRQSLELLCRVHSDLISSVLEDVIQQVSILDDNGEIGWLTKDFLEFFGW